jgi:hypothetical protein
MTDDNSQLFDRVVDEMYHADGEITEVSDENGMRNPPTVSFVVEEPEGGYEALRLATEYGGEVINVSPDGEVCVYFPWAN